MRTTEPQVGIEPTTARHQDCADNPQLSPHQHNRENGSGEQDPDPDSSPASKRQRNGNRPPSVAGAMALAGGIRRQLLAAGLTSRDLTELAKALDPIRASRRDLLVLFALADVIDHADPDAPADLSRCSCGRAKRISFCDVTPGDGAGITAARWICDVCEAPASLEVLRTDAIRATRAFGDAVRLTGPSFGGETSAAGGRP